MENNKYSKLIADTIVTSVFEPYLKLQNKSYFENTLNTKVKNPSLKEKILKTINYGK